MSFMFKVIGFVVSALVAVGVVKASTGMVQGTDTPASVPYRINQEFAEVGLSVPAQGGGYRGHQPMPYQSVPRDTNLEHQLQDPAFGR
jgi:hypothetical protein